MEKKPKKLVPEDALEQIFARLSLRNIARFRSVCKEWKSIMDSDFFRDLFESLKSSSSISWSIMNTRNRTPLEIVGHHGCERWGLTNSLGSYITRNHPETTVRKTSILNCADGLVLVYTETIEGSLMYHVGNPMLQQWVQIPIPPDLSIFDVVRLQENPLFSDSGLVTNLEKGILVGYKVVWIYASWPLSEGLTFRIYSSETRLWETKRKRCSRFLFWSRRLRYSVPLNGILHWLAAVGNTLDANHVVSCDLYNEGDADQFHKIPFPDIVRNEQYRRFKRTISTSAGSVVYCNVFNNNGGRTIRVWRLIDYSTNKIKAAWKLSWKLNTKSSLVGFGADYFPVVMHPLKSEIIYLWSRNKNGLILLNLRTRKFDLQKEESSSEDGKEKKSMDGCIMTFTGCKEYMDVIYPIYFNDILGGFHNLYFSQYVLPRWLNPLPQLSS